MEAAPVDRPNTTLAGARRTPNPETCIMRYRLAFIVIVQCLFVVAFMSRATADETADTRESVQRTEAEKTFVLDQMRDLVAQLNGRGRTKNGTTRRYARSRPPA